MLTTKKFDKNFKCGKDENFKRVLWGKIDCELSFNCSSKIRQILVVGLTKLLAKH